MNKTKYLGVIIDENLDCDEQFKLAKTKISAGLVNLKRLKIFCYKASSALCTMDWLKVICNTLILFGVA